MSEDKKIIDIADRTFKFSLVIVNLVMIIKDDHRIKDLTSQLIRSGTSIGANVEEAQSASSRKDFINKMRIALREARETRYWFRMFYALRIVRPEKLNDIMKENLEIIKVLSVIIKNSKI